MTERLAALRERLHGAAFVSVWPAVNQYLTGFQGSTSGVVVTEEAALFLCDFRYAEQAATQVSDGFEVQQVKGSIAKRIGERLSDAGVKRAVFEPALLTVQAFEAIRAEFPNRFEPDADVVSALRRIKDPAEIETIGAAQRLVEGALEDVVGALEPGCTEREVAARLEYEFKRRGAAGASFDTIVLFGARSSLPHGAPGDTRLRDGDIVLIDLGCRMDGYCSDLTRTYTFGTIPDVWFEEVYDLVLTAQRLALEAARPGLTCRELDATARNLIVEAGYGDCFGHGLGHGVGIEVHEAPRLNGESDAVLAPGMVVTIEPGVYVEGRGGVRIEDLIAITPDGCENLTTIGKELRTVVP